MKLRNGIIVGIKRGITWALRLSAWVMAFGLYAQADLDTALLKERIRKVHGDFRLKLSGEWKAGLEGRNESWKWLDKGWKCGSKESQAACNSWVPQSFLAWQAGAFLEQWTPKNRLSFEVQKPKAVARAKPTEVSEENAGDPEPSSAHVDWGQNWVGELWSFENTKGEALRVLVSARDQRIERMEFPSGAIEYYEWAPGKSGALEIAKLVMEKDGVKAIISRK